MNWLPLQRMITEPAAYLVFDGGMSGSGAFREKFLRALLSRPFGCSPGYIDAHEGLKNAIAKMLRHELAALPRPLQTR
jgi:hypothetical protein